MNNPVLSQAILMASALKDAAVRFNAKGGWVMSSHVAMSLMMALFPFVLFVVALAATLSQEIDVDNLIELIFGSWPDEIAQPITSEVRSVLASANSGLLTVGGVLAIYFASNGVDAVRQAMIQAYRDIESRPYWKARLICLTFVAVGGAILMIAATIGLAVPLYLRFVSNVVPSDVMGWLASDTFATLIAVFLLGAGVAACHIWLPGRSHSLSEILPGVILTILLWGLAGAGFSYYLTRFASYSATYAGLAGVMVALIFLYLMSALLILGAEFNGALAKRALQDKGAVSP
ncbi:YihY/virulence factor BrkB family protein [Sedimentitalea todarodis]|uniref:YihY/virulence factor BrkB family protein n=1 Tax=Sedimentitalea todarodis TaxID=1631240 RepID=A0ABU3VAV8_9RHOB|nr:YihY/virulence factor BrkB family protein [Sedimentitalea todarodis]MDU9003306.1 YihY/virulence factor BrkB family protein [Sedimentitalea todarodis]